MTQKRDSLLDRALNYPPVCCAFPGECGAFIEMRGRLQRELADALDRVKLLENALLEIRDSTFRNSVQLRFIAANTLEKLK